MTGANTKITRLEAIIPGFGGPGALCARHATLDIRRYVCDPQRNVDEVNTVATLPVLVTAMAEVDGRDRKSVEHLGRVIREAGYITSGKRGGGAPDMTVREAANLIIALNGADMPKDAPTAIDRFRSLKQWYRGTADDFRARSDEYSDLPKPLQDVMDVHTFGEALEAVIEDVPEMTGSFLQYLEQGYEGDIERAKKNLPGMIRLGAFGLDIVFERYAASIEMFTRQGSERRIEFEAHFMKDPDRLDSDFYGREWPDRRVKSTIGFHTLMTAWQTLNNGDRLMGSKEETE